MSKYKTTEPEVSCFTCTRPDMYCDHVECFDVVPELGELYEYNELELPRKCGFYDPYKIKHCEFCESVINEFMYKYPFWFNAGECAYPLCQNCFDAVPEEILSEKIYCTC
jgi:hypothetical protein